MTASKEMTESGSTELDPARRYVSESLLATGGQGEVYLGQDTLSGRQVVIKRLRPELSQEDPTFVARFLREGEALDQLDHPNIVKMLAAFEDGGQHQIVMEFVPGGSLRDLLESEGQLEVERALDIALELADALSRAHHLGVIHRDIKPGNVLLAADGTPRLTDFGLARVEKGDSQLTQVGSVMGSPAYMSPESIRGEGPDVRSDIWSFGTLIFEMLTGTNPFKADTISATMARILTDPSPDLRTQLPNCPPALGSLVGAMLIKDREERLSSMRQVAAEVEAIRQGDESSSSFARFREAVGDLEGGVEAGSGLPLPATPFVGREKEMADLSQLLVDAQVNRLVTLVGPGGIGKSRLALETAARSAKNFPDGVFFVPLAPLTSPDHIVPAISEHIGFRYFGGGEPKQQLLSYLSRKSMLIVMDNFEQLIGGGASLVAEIVHSAPNIKLLVTSRERLLLSGEAIYHLGGMTYPIDEVELKRAADFGAVKLLEHHARLVRPDLSWDHEQVMEMGRICELVQGMPLAVVLAAGWLEMLSLEEITEEISHSLDILESETRDLPERQRSVRAAFDYSWKRLATEDRRVFEKLSLFRGGFSRRAAQEICGAGLRALRNLTEKSLITTVEVNRYEIHELLRQFIEEKLVSSGAAEETGSKHSAYYLSAVAVREADLKGGRQLEALDEIEEDLENVRAAWKWAVGKKDWPEIDKCIEGQYLFFDMRSRFQEGVEFIQTALDSISYQKNKLLWERLKIRQCWLQSRYSTDVLEIGVEAEQCLAIAEQHGSQTEIAFSLLTLGYYYSKVLTDFDVATPYFEASLAKYHQLDEPFFLARNYIRLGYCYGDIEMAKFMQFTEKGLDVALESGNKVLAATALINLGSGHFGMGDYSQVKSMLNQGITMAMEIRDRITLAHGPMLLGLYYLLQGDFNQAYLRASKALAIADEIRFKITMGYAFGVLSAQASLTGDPTLGLELGQRSIATPSNPFGKTIGNWALATAYCGLGKYDVAGKLIRQIIEICLRTVWPGMITWVFPLEALIQAGDGSLGQAVQYLSLGINHPLSPRGWVENWDVLADLRNSLEEALGETVFQEHWEAGKSLDLEETARLLIESAEAS